MPLKDLEARRAYQRKYLNQRYAQDSEYRKRHLDRVAKNRRRTNREIQSLIENFRKNGCVACGELEKCCLQLSLGSHPKGILLGSLSSKRCWSRYLCC